MAQGLSLVRAVFSAERTARMGSDPGAEAKALETSARLSGVPVMMERFGCGARASGRRTMAVTVWLRARASAMAREPVLPLPPRTRIRIVTTVDFSLQLSFDVSRCICCEATLDFASLKVEPASQVQLRIRF